MSKADYPYPDDEFDVGYDPDAPRGVHRAPRSTWSRWWPFLVVLVVAPALAFGAVTVWGMLNEPSAQSPGPVTGDDDGAAEEPVEESPETTTETPVEEVPAPTPVMTTAITVYNAAGVQGLAGRQAKKLTDAGFTTVQADNKTASGDSTVYFASEDLRATAELVGQTLGLTTIVMSPADAPSGISVVLTTDPDA